MFFWGKEHKGEREISEVAIKNPPRHLFLLLATIEHLYLFTLRIQLKNLHFQIKMFNFVIGFGAICAKKNN